ncbi:MAG: hypothetical protein KatS3mg108_3635 [Isosphaeraceae bacterium]|nr:MAG: hypothetical protein KatS3mg108_3635 [Isosphaeraceae bacterium]
MAGLILWATGVVGCGLTAGGPIWVRQEIDPRAGEVVYAVTVADVNGDRRLDVVAVTEDAVLWYENPSWRKRVVVEGATARDNVCIAARDIDGDGQIDFALGAGWKPPDTVTPGTLQWLGRDGAGQWKIHIIEYEEPSIHRMRWADVDGDGVTELVIVPLQGRGTMGPDWGAGKGVRIWVLRVPEDPTARVWASELADDTLHTAHNFEAVSLDDDPAEELIVAAWEGVFRLDRLDDGRWTRTKLGDGYQGGDLPHRGASEIKLGKVGDQARDCLATIEPWHGDRVVVYVREIESKWVRREVDTGVKWGHAVWFANVDEDPSQELIIGQRDPRTDTVTPKGPGVFVYDLESWLMGGHDSGIEKWVVDDGGMACEDALAADLDGDGRPEIIAGGRATHNVVVYWNRSQD